MSVFRRVRPYLPGLAVLFALLLVSPVFAQTAETSAAACTFGRESTAAVTNVIAGFSTVLLVVAVLSGLQAARSGGGGGGAEMFANGLGGMIGLAMLLGLLGLVGFFAVLIRAAAGLPACA